MAHLDAPEYAPFEALKHIDEFGTELWLARDLSKALEYDTWRRFQDALNRAMIACDHSAIERVLEASPRIVFQRLRQVSCEPKLGSEFVDVLQCFKRGVFRRVEMGHAIPPAVVVGQETERSSRDVYEASS